MMVAVAPLLGLKTTSIVPIALIVVDLGDLSNKNKCLNSAIKLSFAKMLNVIKTTTYIAGSNERSLVLCLNFVKFISTEAIGALGDSFGPRYGSIFRF